MQIKQQSSHFLRGFQQLIPKEWIDIFNEHELQVTKFMSCLKLGWSLDFILVISFSASACIIYGFVYSLENCVVLFNL